MSFLFLSRAISPLIRARFVVLMMPSRDGEEGSASECQSAGAYGSLTVCLSGGECQVKTAAVHNIRNGRPSFYRANFHFPSVFCRVER